MINNFLIFCKKNNFEININQIKTLKNLVKFFYKKKFFTFNYKKKLGFYLFGDVGVGKTMLLDFYFDQLNIKKNRMHFNEFMINFHDNRHQNKSKDNFIEAFVKQLKRQFDLIYLDEFQVTNIVDAMILGKLFETIFDQNIRIILSSNTKIDDLYKDGLQRDQFIPFIKIIKDRCIQHELVIEQDYRKLALSKLERYFYPINEQNTFNVNQIFRRLTKDKKKSLKILNVKGRDFKIENYYEGIARFSFNDLCAVNIGAEDYLTIAEACRFVLIDNIPIFNDDNADKQHRFVTMIDIFYEKKLPMMVSSNFNLENYSSSQKLLSVFKRTASRLFELTSPKFEIS